ncbi:hypothetical protein B600_0493 [Chlamydia psittaci VS225]|nr:hypothetical protein B600_0493 [Chlamydia psittaci VS225]
MKHTRDTPVPRSIIGDRNDGVLKVTSLTLELFFAVKTSISSTPGACIFLGSDELSVKFAFKELARSEERKS